MTSIKDRDKQVQDILEVIAAYDGKPVTLMEVCGTHTVAIAKSGLKQLLPPSVRLISGPGCPVCVTAREDLDAIISLARQPGVIVATYGDMIRVPGSTGSLQEEKARGADVRVIYSALDALQLARENPHREVVLLGIGFETTAPTVAVVLEQAIRSEINNFSIYGVNKAVPPVLKALLQNDDLRLDGFLLPGHVSVVTGLEAFQFLAEGGLPGVVAGFDPVDILEALGLLLEQLKTGQARIINQYRQVVQSGGNRIARAYLEKYFTLAEAQWRGLGALPASGYTLKDEYQEWDARRRFELSIPEKVTVTSCSCGEILQGKKEPADCPLFGKNCTPFQPIGPCMVSQEGTCAAYYHFSVES